MIFRTYKFLDDANIILLHNRCYVIDLLDKITNLIIKMTITLEFEDEKLKQKHFHSNWLSPRFFKKASGILQSPPSVRPSVTLVVYGL